MTGPPTVHVLPKDDLIDHDRTEDCICGPETELRQLDPGGDLWLVIHQSLDRREDTDG